MTTAFEISTADYPVHVKPIRAIEIRGDSKGSWSVFSFVDGWLEHRKEFSNLFLAMSYARKMNEHNEDGK